MNDNITAFIHAFILEQEVKVYQNGECIKTVKCTLDDLEETIYSLVNLYNIKQINLAGNQLYSLRVKEKMMDSKYNKFKDKLEINIY